MSEPSDPTPDEPPEDPIEVACEAIRECKDKILHYDGSCYAGNPAIMPGRWYKQPIYREIICESATIKPDLLKFQDDRAVMVGATGGSPSTPFMYKTCKRLKETAEKYDWIKKIVILYFGDSDKKGHEIRKNVENALKWYSGGGSDEFIIPVPVELRLVAITPDQVKKFKLTGYQLRGFYDHGEASAGFQTHRMRCNRRLAGMRTYTMITALLKTMITKLMERNNQRILIQITICMRTRI